MTEPRDQGTVAFQLRRANAIIAELYGIHQLGDVTIPQLSILRALRGGAPLNQTQLVARSGLDRSTLSAIMPGLETRGYIARMRTAKDTRANMVSMTKRGKKAMGDADVAMVLVERLVVSRVPKAERVGFLAALQWIVAGGASF